MQTTAYYLGVLRAAVAPGSPLWRSARDLLPIAAVIVVFQLFVFQRPLANLPELLAGFVLIVVGLSLFVAGLEIGLFPLGEQMAGDFAVRGSAAWLMAFAFALGFGTTLAEPGLIAVASKAAERRIIDADADRQAAARSRFALKVRVTVAVAVGCALVLGALRIILGWPVQYLLLPIYAVVLLLMLIAPRDLVGLACDVGVIAMSTITVPLTAALGIGLAASIRGRSALIDGFGMIALAAAVPSLFVLVGGTLWP
jgi:hypothetical protein